MSDDPTDDIDPFEDIAPEETPDGDPFDEFEPADDESNGSEGTDSEDTGSGVDTEPAGAEQPFEGVNVTDQHSVETRGERGRPANADPFADLTEEFEDDPFEGGEWDASGTDESVWESLSAEPEIEVEEESGRRISTVNKHSFCEQCEYFTEPPEIACTHTGTDIMEFIDIETVRVVDCPIVEERERLEGTSKQRAFESDHPK